MRKLVAKISFPIVALMLGIVACDIKNSEVTFAPIPTNDKAKLSETEVAVLEWKPEFPDPVNGDQTNKFLIEISLEKTPTENWVVTGRPVGEVDFRAIGVLSPTHTKLIDKNEGGKSYEYVFKREKAAPTDQGISKTIEVLRDWVVFGESELDPERAVPYDIRAYRFIFLPTIDGTPPILYTHRTAMNIECVEFIGHKDSAFKTGTHWERGLVAKSYIPRKPGPVVIRAQRARGHLSILPSFSRGKEDPRNMETDFAQDGAQSYQIFVSEKSTLEISTNYREGFVAPREGWTDSVRPSWLDVKGERQFLSAMPLTVSARKVSGLYHIEGPLIAKTFISPGMGIVYSLPTSRGPGDYKVSGDGASFFSTLDLMSYPSDISLEKLLLSTYSGNGEMEKIYQKLLSSEYEGSETTSLLMKLNNQILNLNTELSISAKTLEVAFIKDGREGFSPTQLDLLDRLHTRTEKLKLFMEARKADQLILVNSDAEEVLQTNNVLYVGKLSASALQKLIADLDSGALKPSEAPPTFRLPPALSPRSETK